MFLEKFPYRVKFYTKVEIISDWGLVASDWGLVTRDWGLVTSNLTATFEHHPIYIRVEAATTISHF